MVKQPVSLVALRAGPAEQELSKALKLGIKHDMKGVTVTLDRFKLKILWGFFNASQVKQDKPTYGKEFIEFISVVMAKAAKDDGFGSYNRLVKPVIGATVKYSHHVNMIANECKPRLYEQE